MSAVIEPQLLIFDCDGVLVDSEPLAARALAETASEAGLPLNAADCIARFTGIALADVLRAIEADLGRPLPTDFRARLEARDRAAFAADLRAVDGVGEAIVRLPWRRCVASSGTHEKMRFTLGLTGLLPLFEPHLFSAIEVARGKPAPDLFLLAASRMGVRPDACLVIEDAVPGILAARAAGMRAFGFAGGSHRRPGERKRLLAAGAQAVFSAMSELPGLLGVGQVGAAAMPARGLVEPPADRTISWPPRGDDRG
jgi:HAD superfamily hydrolase (TIGR01509 family)